MLAAQRYQQDNADLKAFSGRGELHLGPALALTHHTPIIASPCGGHSGDFDKNMPDRLYALIFLCYLRPGVVTNVTNCQ